MSAAPSSAGRPVRIAVDIGGTFTDPIYGYRGHG